MHKKYLRPAQALALGAALTSLTPDSQAGFPAKGAQPAQNDPGQSYVQDEILIRFNPDAPAAGLENALARIGGRITKHVQTPAMAAQNHGGISRVVTKLPVQQALQALQNHPAVLNAEPNYIYTKQSTPIVNDRFYANDPDYQLWGLFGGAAGNVTWPYNNFGSQADEAWFLGFNGLDGQFNAPATPQFNGLGPVPTDEVVVGVIDEGICYYHPDLVRNMGNPNEIGLYQATDGDTHLITINGEPLLVNTANDGIDNDNNGAVDDEAEELYQASAGPGNPIFNFDGTAYQPLIVDRASDLVDNDDNGKVDDAYGWDFLSEDNSVFDPLAGDPDMDAHGTHVSGTIGAQANNVLGVAGVIHNVKIISGKFLGPQGGTTLDAIQAVDYFTDLKLNRGVNLVALNNSWGGGGYSTELHAAINRAAHSGILFLAAAGNGNRVGTGQDNDRTPSYPSSYDTTLAAGTLPDGAAASYDAVIAVAAIDSAGNKASFSNYGASSVDLAAPGVTIVSTYPYQVNAITMDPNNAFMPYNGTSMATPHVTGAVALYAAHWPGASAEAIKDAILGRALPTSSMQGRCTSNGRLSLLGIEQQPQEPPAAPPATPSALSAQPFTKGKISLAWSDSDTETGYELQRSTDGSFTSSVATFKFGANVLSALDSGLRSGKLYYYRIRAFNKKGHSDWRTAPAVKAP